jgi:hypothetical protein
MPVHDATNTIVHPGPAISIALKVRSLLLPDVQDPSNQCLLQYDATQYTFVTETCQLKHINPDS